MHIGEWSAPDSNSLEVEIATEKLKKYKFPGTDQILAELIQAGSKTLHYILYILFGISNNYHRSERNL
jgi:hypothetical protein